MSENTITALIMDKNTKRPSPKQVRFGVNEETLKCFNDHSIKIDIYYFNDNVIMYAFNDGQDNIASYKFDRRLEPMEYKNAFKYITDKIKVIYQ